MCEQVYTSVNSYLQIGDEGFGFFHPDDAFCSQVFLPGRDG